MFRFGHVESIGRDFVLIFLGAFLFFGPIRVDPFKRLTDPGLRRFYKSSTLILAVFANILPVIVLSVAEAVFVGPFPANPTRFF